MKINFRPMMRKWVYVYSMRYGRCLISNSLANGWSPLAGSGIITILMFIGFSIVGNAQEYTHTFVHEVSTTNEQITISTNVPSSLSIEIDGVYGHRSNTKFGYIIRGKNDQDRLYINKDYFIETWDKNVVRQEVDVTIRSKNERSAKELLRQLAIKLPFSDSAHLIVDANMNFDKFAMQNRRFKEDYCVITLDEGSSYEVSYLEIRTRLFIPRKSNLEVHSILHHTLHLGDIEGDLDLDIQYGEVFGKKISNLNANLRFCFNVIFEEANIVRASATNSHLKISKVNEVELGSIRLGKGPLVHGDRIHWLDNNSSMNIYDFRDVNQMRIHDSANDDFNLGEINDLAVFSSIYSDYKILKINSQMKFKGNNGDLSVAELGRGAEIVDIQSKLSKLNINVGEEENYIIRIFDHERVERRLPSAARPLANNDESHLLYQMGSNKDGTEINIRCDRCELDIWE